MSPRTGRPPSSEPKEIEYKVRLSADDKKRLEYCAKATGLAKAEIIRRGIKIVYEETKAQIEK